ncbi:sensor histidine kinase [Saccharicrinis aurantiacus]|uniref:sensor histidine kinase n=1 Tax=Saccharicrinis aurantiacus TaxID=1849719 RepID=UPI00094F9F55|nr:HAMP domain-containing sensor histidine kinase [Saccharicrinis aurantiacus]
MTLYDYITITFISVGAVIMLLSANRTKRILNMLPTNKLRGKWRGLSISMFVFFIGYLFVVLLVILGRSELLEFLSGIIFLLGSHFVFIVVSSGLDSFKKIKEINQNLSDTELKNKELERFAYVTSHDLKAPLRGIYSLASFIKADLEDGQTEEVQDHLNTLLKQVERLENLINGILHYSKIGKITVEAINLNLLVHEEYEKYQNLNNVKLEIQGTLPTINGDKTQISQLISNLLNNAIEYNDKKLCQITISSEEKPNFYEISFEDNGPGIPSKYHEKIFEVFQTLAHKDIHESTGIGLSIVKKIMDKHEGEVKVESDGKLGTKFIIVCSKKLK